MGKDYKNVLTYEDVKNELDSLFNELYCIYSDLYSDYNQLLKVLNNIDIKKNKSIYTQENNENALKKLIETNIPGKIREEYVITMENLALVKMIPIYMKKNLGIEFTEYDFDHIQDFSYIDSFIHKRFYPIQKDIRLARMISLVSYMDRLLDSRLNYEIQLDRYVDTLDDEDLDYIEVPDEYDDFTIDNVINNVEFDPKAVMCTFHASQLRNIYNMGDKKERKTNNKVLTDLMFTNQTLEDKWLDALDGTPFRIQISYNIKDKLKFKTRILDCIKGIERYNSIFEKYKSGSNDKSPINLNNKYFENIMLTYLNSQYQLVDDKTLDEMGRFLNMVSTNGKKPLNFGDGLVINGSTVDSFFNSQVRELKNQRKRSQNN